MKNRLIHAYQQTPWRQQMKWGSSLLLVLVIIVMVAGIYLSISAQAAAMSVEMSMLESERNNLMESIADDQTQLAVLTSVIEMEKRAQTSNIFVTPASPPVYLIVPGYTPPQPTPLASQRDMNPFSSHSPIKATYKQSLWEWLMEDIIVFEKDGMQEGT